MKKFLTLLATSAIISAPAFPKLKSIMQKKVAIQNMMPSNSFLQMESMHPIKR